MKAATARRLRTVGALTGVLALAGLTTAPVFAADSSGSGDVKVVNTETVQVYMSADGDIQSKRVYEQLALSGHGSVDLKNPVSTDGLRNIDGFGGFDVKDGEQIVKTTVDGTKHYRAVSNFTGTLPVSVTTEYTLNGKHVAPGDVVGKSGKLAVKFVVTNKTSTKQQVTIADGSGGTITKTVDVPVPMVGSLTTTAPSNFTNVDPGGASTAGDGTGGTTMSYTMTLFPPIGSDSATLGYTADITDGVVPRVDVALLPVDPLSSPTFKTAGDSYKGGADTGAQLVTGAGTIDGNLLKLRDGAADLLAGLIKLSDGSADLNAGLANDAAPGAKKLAAGTGDALDGSEQLADGADKLNGGLKQLKSGVSALPASVQTQLANDADYKALLGALQSIADGIGTRSDLPTAGTLLGGLNGVQYGMRYPGGYAATDCAVALAGGTPTKCGAMDGVQFIAEQLAAGATSLDGLKPLLAGLRGYINTVVAGSCPAYVSPTPTPATPCETVSTLYYGLFGTTPPLPSPGAQQQVNLAAGALQGIQQKVQLQLLASGAGLDQLRGGLNNPGANANCLVGKSTASPSDDCGIKEAAIFLKNAGIPRLVDGLTAQVSTTLLAGINQLADGSGQLADGAGDLADGLGQIDSGANDLATGLGDAADGSGQIADGLKTASGSTPQLVDGAGRLSKEGMGELIKAGKDTAVNYGELYAVIKAGSERAQTSAMAYGAPTGAEGLTAYAFTITGEDGEGSRNLTRGVGALALGGLGASICLIRRRMA